MVGSQHQPGNLRQHGHERAEAGRRTRLRVLATGVLLGALLLTAGLIEPTEETFRPGSGHQASIDQAGDPGRVGALVSERGAPGPVEVDRTAWLLGFPEIAAPVDLGTDPALAAVDAKTQRKINRLTRKKAKLAANKAKTQAWIDARNQKISGLGSDISSWQAAISDAQSLVAAAEAMPAGSKAQIKARKKALRQAQRALARANKMVARLQKRVTRFQGQVARKETQLGVLQGGMDSLDDQVDALTPGGGMPDPGSQGLGGLQLPEQMNMVTSGGGSGGASAPASMPGAPGGVPQDSDYYNDVSHEYVYDPSMEPLEMVNEILTMITQTAHDVMVNRGPYNALIDMGDMDKGQDTSSDDAGQSSGQTEELELWVVNSVRADADADQYVACWVPMGDEEDGEGDPKGGDDMMMEPPGSIHVLTRIEEGISDANPFGIFSMDFAGVPDLGGAAKPFFWGTLETMDAAQGSMGFTFFETMGNPKGDFFERSRVHVNMNLEGTAGVGHVHELMKGRWGPGGTMVTEDSTYLVAFDGVHLLRSIDAEPGVCVSREAYQTNVWRYNLYHAIGDQAGERVKRNSGFGFRTADDFFGWAGYWGMWVPEESTLASGDTVFRDRYDGSEAEPYTVLIAPGKLIMNVRQELPLQELDGARFEWWYCPPMFDPGPGDPGEQDWVEPQEYLVQYSHGDGQFWKTAARGPDGMWQDLDVPEPVDTATIQWLGMWSKSLGGSVNYLHGDAFVTFFKEEVVNGASSAFGGADRIELQGYMEMLRPAVTAAEAAMGDVFLDEAQDLATPHRLVFQRDDLTLYHDVNGDGSSLLPVGLVEGASYEGGPYEWGMRSGPMVTDTSGMSDVWDAWGQSVFFTYETGPHPWNRYSTLVDAQGVAVDFDPPVQFAYTHEAADDRNGDATYAGQTFMLEYNGCGDLWGIPFAGFDTDDDGFEDRWYPMFSIADGTLMGPTGAEFVLRAMEMEQTLAKDPGGCSALNIDTVGNLPLPDGSNYEFPNIGDKPVVTDPPAVIAGEVQGGN